MDAEKGNESRKYFKFYYKWIGLKKKCNINFGDIILLSYIKSFEETGSTFYGNDKYLCHIMCENIRTVQKRLLRLKKTGLIKINYVNIKEPSYNGSVIRHRIIQINNDLVNDIVGA